MVRRGTLLTAGVDTARVGGHGACIHHGHQHDHHHQHHVDWTLSQREVTTVLMKCQNNPNESLYEENSTETVLAFELGNTLPPS